MKKLDVEKNKLEYLIDKGASYEEILEQSKLVDKLILKWLKVKQGTNDFSKLRKI